jgi:hypothetical protein
VLRTFETFDEDASPLQKGMLDARDKKWSKKVKLGTDPRCRRVVREFAKRPNAEPRLCLDPVGDKKDGTFIGREACLEKYCCDEDDCTANLACANALIDGGDTSSCFDGQLVQAAGNNKTCIDEIFKQSEGKKNVDCLEDPFTTKDGDTFTLKQECKKMFEGEGPNPAFCEDLAPAGKIKKWKTENGKGRRIQTQTVIHYRQPKERKDLEDGEPDTWDEIDIRSARSSAERKGVPGAGPQLDKQLSAGGFNIDCNPLKRCDENEDRDCYDRVTGEHMSGDTCFVGEYLRSTLELSPTCSGEFDICCTHTETGELLEGDDCLPETVDGHDIRTTLVQLVDEDPPDDSLNNDGDCCLDTGNGCRSLTITSDCLDDDGLLRDGYRWNLDEETSCAEAATNVDNDCMVVLEETDDCQPTCPDMVCDGELPSPCRSDEDCQDGAACIENTNCPGEVECHRGETVIGYLVGNDACVLDWRQGGMTIANQCDPDSPVSPCWTALVGEDCQESIDNDGDELLDEDGPAEPISLAALALVDNTGDTTLARETEACTAVFARFGVSPDTTELPAESHGCKIDRLMRLEVNRKLKERCDAETQALAADGECTFETRSGGKKKVFDVDEEGQWCSDTVACDESNRGAVHPVNDHQPKGQSKKYEERQVTVDEVFGIQCKPIKIGAAWQQTEYDPETGNCIVPAPVMLERAAAELGTGWEDTCDSETPPEECFQAMMGFTFAPPVIEWGWRIETEACLFGYCFEIFFARVGYEFDLAAGVRLPVQIDFDSVPDSVLLPGHHPRAARLRRRPVQAFLRAARAGRALVHLRLRPLLLSRLPRRP